MSHWHNQLNQKIKQAMLDKDRVALTTLRGLKSTFLQVEKEQQSNLNDDQVFNLITKAIKQRNEAITQFQKANRFDLVTKEQQERDLLQTFLPEPMSDSALKALVQEAIEIVNASSIKDIGAVIGWCKERAKGQASAQAISLMARKLLTQPK